MAFLVNVFLLNYNILLLIINYNEKQETNCDRTMYDEYRPICVFSNIIVLTNKKLQNLIYYKYCCIHLLIHQEHTVRDPKIQKTAFKHLWLV